MNYFVVQIWEDEKTDSSQGGKDFFLFKAVKSHGFKCVFFSAVSYMLCSFVDCIRRG